MTSLKYGYLLVGVAAIIGAFLTLLYLMRLFDKVFLGEQKIAAHEGHNPLMVGTVIALGAMALILGITIKLPLKILSLLSL